MEGSYLENREYVHKSIEHFTSVFKFYIVESLKQEYGDEYLNVIWYGPGYDKEMAESQSQSKETWNLTL